MNPSKDNFLKLITKNSNAIKRNKKRIKYRFFYRIQNRIKLFYYKVFN